MCVNLDYNVSTVHGIWVFLYILSTLKNKSEGNTHQHMNESRLACVTISIDTIILKLCGNFMYSSSSSGNENY